MPYQKRIQKFRSAMETNAYAAFLPVSADLQYLTGVSRDSPTFGAVRHPGDWIEGMWLSLDKDPVLTLTRMTAEFNTLETSGMDVRILGDFDDPQKLAASILSSFALMPNSRIALGDTTRAETIFHLLDIAPNIKFISASELISPQRMVKDEHEIEILRHAGQITIRAFEDVLKSLKHGMTELEIVSEIDYQLRRHGGLGPSFNSTLYNAGPQHELLFGRELETWPRRLEPPVTILFDFGAVHQGYCYDFGRTVLFGEPDPHILRVHKLVMDSQLAGILAMQAGAATAAQVDAASRQVIEEAGLGEHFRHRLGHGIGLDVHEAPFLTASDHTQLQEGMCFTVEPSIIFERNLSARVEDVVLVGPDGGLPLTSVHQDLIVIE